MAIASTVKRCFSGELPSCKKDQCHPRKIFIGGLAHKSGSPFGQHSSWRGWLRPWYDFRATLRIAWFLVGKTLRTTTQHLRDYFAFLAWLTEFSHSPQELKFVVMKWDHWIRTPLRGKKTKCRQFFVFCNSLVWSTSLSNAGPRHWPGEIWRDCWCGGLVRLSVLFRSGSKSHQELSFSLSSFVFHVIFFFR